MWQSLEALSACDEKILTKQDLYYSELALAKLNDRICLTLCDGALSGISTPGQRNIKKPHHLIALFENCPT